MEQFADLNKIKGFLLKSKQVMDKADSGDYEKGFIDEGFITGEKVYASANKPATAKQVSNISEESIENSKLPDSIKMAMKSNIIQPPEIKPFTLDEDDEFERKVPMPSQIKRKPISESSNSVKTAKSDLSEEKIRAIVHEELNKFFSSYFIKDIQKETIKTLITKGIIKK